MSFRGILGLLILLVWLTSICSDASYFLFLKDFAIHVTIGFCIKNSYNRVGAIARVYPMITFSCIGKNLILLMAGNWFDLYLQLSSIQVMVYLFPVIPFTFILNPEVLLMESNLMSHCPLTKSIIHSVLEILSPVC